jgi:hypothetical protein
MSDFRSCLLARYEIEKFTSFLDRVLPMVNATGKTPDRFMFCVLVPLLLGQTARKSGKS